MLSYSMLDSIYVSESWHCVNVGPALVKDRIFTFLSVCINILKRFSESIIQFLKTTCTPPGLRGPEPENCRKMSRKIPSPPPSPCRKVTTSLVNHLPRPVVVSDVTYGQVLPTSRLKTHILSCNRMLCPALFFQPAAGWYFHHGYGLQFSVHLLWCSFSSFFTSLCRVEVFSPISLRVEKPTEKSRFKLDQ